MATLQKHGDGWYCQFLYERKRRTLTIGEVSEREAYQWKIRTEQLLLRLRQNLMQVPPGVSIVEFLKHDGKPPVDPALSVRKDTTFSELREAYVKTFSNGAIEASTLATAKIHLAHIEQTLGKRFLLSGLTLGRLQGHIDRRQKSVAPVTIKKEISTFRAAFNWAARSKLVQGSFPCAGLVYPKTDEKLPFMTWDEIERRIKAGGNPSELWESLYLNTDQVAALLEYVKQKKAPDWVYPMIAMAAHTGARRSEMIRAKTEDVNLAEMVINIREKKRTRGARTHRRIPVSKLLATVLTRLLANKREGEYLFGSGEKPLTVQAAYEAFVRVLAGSKWSVVKGWHTLRHSMVSACASKGIDQRILDGWVGHQTDEQRVRYRHLYPSVQEAAINRVFA